MQLRRILGACAALPVLTACATPALQTRAVSAEGALPSMRRVPSPVASAAANRSTTPAPTPAGWSGTDWSQLVERDPQVPTVLKKLVRECREDSEPCGIEPTVRFADVTGDGEPEALVGFYDLYSHCGDALFMLAEGRPRLLIGHYGPNSATEIAGQLVVLTREMYAPHDPEEAPSGRPQVTSYRWNGSSLTIVSRTGGGPGLAPFNLHEELVVP